MKRILEFFLRSFFWIALWFRYRIKIKGLEHLNPKTLKNPGGVLFLPNHPCAFVDPVVVSLAVWKKYPIRPMIVEYMYYTPGIHAVMRFLDALPVPNFNNTSNSLKRSKIEKMVQTVINNLKTGQNFLIYPAGKLKHSGYESIGGASAVHQIIHEAPEANIVLVRTKGLWGSSFSTYYTGKTPPVFPTIWEGVKCCFKNLLFFTPRREIIIELVPAPADFPYKGSRVELNRYLENWYNKPDGMTPQQGELPGDSLVLVSYSMWGEKYLEVQKAKSTEDANIKLELVSADVKNKVFKKIAELSETDPSTITPDMDLAADLGMDSLDVSEISAFLNDNFDIKGVPVNQLTTVRKVLGIASKQTVLKDDGEEEQADISKWFKPVKKERLTIAPGETIPEVFLNNCEKMGKAIACGDMRVGVLTYPQLKMRVLLLAEYIRGLPGEAIGILMPSSVVSTMLILATQIAGKTPVMVNWTVGSRHLESVVKLSNIQVILSSWAFLDRLENVELNIVEDMLIMLEDVRRELGLFAKLKALYRSKLSAKSILKIFKTDRFNKDSRAVLLFTSGTESMPKGVPLTHQNILSNVRATFQTFELYSDDVLFGILPPFHSFGFSIGAMFGPLSGMKVAYSPDPTDGRRLANGMEKWGITIVCAAPTFLKSMFKASTPEQLKTMRYCVSGAEKAPKDLFQTMERLGKKDRLIEGYGITECSPILTANPFQGVHKGVGKPLPGIEICIVHPETGQDLPIGTDGLILARGPNIFSGYLNKDVVSPFMEHNGKKWYKTGDLGNLDENNYLTISGRLKRFIKVGGEMVSLGSIEDALLQTAIKKGWPTAEEGPSLAICAKETPGEKPKIFLFTLFDANLEDINNSLKDSGFSNLVRISSVQKVSEIPIMGTGKVNYRALEGQYLK